MGGWGQWRGQELCALPVPTPWSGLDWLARTLGGGGCERQDRECGCWRPMPARGAAEARDCGCAGVRAACARGERGNRFGIILLGEEASEQDKPSIWAK